MGFSPRDDVHWIPTPFRNNQWNLTNRDGPPDLAQLRRHGSGVPKLSLSGLRIASLIMLELLFWTYFKLLLDVATIYNYIHWFCTILHMFAILYLGDSKLDHWLELQQKAERCGAINRPGEHRLQWRTWIASNLGVYRYRFLWIFLTWQPVLVTSKMPLRMPGRTGGHRSALYIGRTPHSRGKEKDAVPMNLDLQPRSVKLGSYRHNFVQLASCNPYLPCLHNPQMIHGFRSCDYYTHFMNELFHGICHYYYCSHYWYTNHGLCQ